MAPELCRCPWPGKDDLYLKYHDCEWGVPVRDDTTLFEVLILEGAQAGLSWILVLRRREALRAALEGFDPVRLASWGEEDLARALQAPGMIRNRLKVAAVRDNARALLALWDRGESLSGLFWDPVGGVPEVHAYRLGEPLPPHTEASRSLSRELKRRGFRFVGPTGCYAAMQALNAVDSIGAKAKPWAAQILAFADADAKAPQRVRTEYIKRLREHIQQTVA